MNFFNQQATRNVIVSFMDFFSRFYIEKYKTLTVSGDSYFAQRKVIPVPIQYATREKWVEIVRSSSGRKAMDPAIRELNPVEMQWILPRISCNLLGVTYDSNRKLIKTQKIDNIPNTVTSSQSKDAVYSPAPFNLEIEISTISRTLDENLQLFEQIIPYFSPALSMTLKLYPDKEPESVPFVLNSISMDNPVDIPENDERFFVNIYNFTVKLNYYMPSKNANIIRNIQANLINGQQVVQIGKEWIDSLAKIQSKYNQYTLNSTIVNPLVVNRTQEDISAELAKLTPMPTLLLTDNGDNTFSINFSNPTSALPSYFNKFKIFYQIDELPEVYEYVGPSQPIPEYNIKYWYVFSLSTTEDNSAMEQFEHTFHSGIGYATIGVDFFVN